MPSEGFEPEIPVSERTQTHALVFCLSYLENYDSWGSSKYTWKEKFDTEGDRTGFDGEYFYLIARIKKREKNCSCGIEGDYIHYEKTIQKL